MSFNQFMNASIMTAMLGKIPFDLIQKMARQQRCTVSDFLSEHRAPLVWPDVFAVLYLLSLKHSCY